LTPLWIGTSWKMNKTLSEGLAFAQALHPFARSLDKRVQPFVIPPFTCLREVAAALAGTSVRVGAQNMHWADAGAWTGEISPVMLKDCGAGLVELGHSERRQHFGETDATVGLKVAAAVRHGLTPLICVGETYEEREDGRARTVLERQVEGALAALDGEARSAAVLFAYEPVWAIGEKGMPASADYADSQQAFIRAVAGRYLAASPPVLYGGSVNAANCAELIGQPNVDGLFIGRAAWRAKDYMDIIERVLAAMRERHQTNTQETRP
jgi:triosephosphate isomerase